MSSPSREGPEVRQRIGVVGCTRGARSRGEARGSASAVTGPTRTRRALAALGFFAAFSFALLATNAQAQQGAPQVPPQLAPWVPWVLHDAGDAACPLVASVRTCVWPTGLALDVDGKGGSFTLRVSLDREAPVTLPGGPGAFPEQVQVGGKPHPVLDLQGTPTLMLARGNHVITGRYTWRSLPDTLKVPPHLGLLSLRVSGSAVSFPKREDNGLLWLRRSSAAAEAEEERLELSVHRLIEDGVPVKVHTRIRLSAAGKAREVVLPDVLVPGTRPIELHASLPAQLSPEGTLRVQVHAGDYQVQIIAVTPLPQETLNAPSPPAPWPAQEAWVFSADDALRHVELSGAPQIDPARADLPPEWKHLPAFLVARGQGLKLDTRRRGQPEPPPNQLNLHRTMWLDLDGGGYTLHDRLSGTMQRDFRVALLAAPLGRAELHGVDQVITQQGEHTGVELRNREVALTTEWRLEGGGAELPAVGYDQDVQSLHTELNLPPGFKLLGATGVDQPSGTWIHGWDLFDFFFVLLVSLAVGKLAGRPFFVVALLTLVLTHEEPEAPALSWLVLIAMAALLRVVREGESPRWHKLVRAGHIAALLGLLLVLVPFAADQIRAGLYPHLAWSDLGYARPTSRFAVPMTAHDVMLQEEAPAPPEATEAPAGGAEDSAEVERRAYAPSLGKRAPSKEYSAAKSAVSARQESDPNQVVQTGPGLPSWEFRSYQLHWSGPVERDQTLRLWILPPPLTRLWSFASVLLSALLLWGLLRARGPASSPSPRGGAVALATLLALGALPRAQAQDFPPQALLDTLRERLTEPARCEPNCVSVPHLNLRVEGAQITLRAEVHAGADSAYRVPGPLDSFSPQSVRVDGKDAFAATRLDDGFLYLRLTPGIHQVELSGPMPRNQSLTLAMGTPPQRVEVDAKGYTVEGLSPEGRVEGSLSLRRDIEQRDDGEGLGDPEEAAEALPTWLMVRRELELGVRFRLRTVIQRIGHTGGSVVIKLPLLPGEQVTENGLVSDGDAVLVELPRGEREKSFQSTLAPRGKLEFKAPLPAPQPDGPITQPWSETWVIQPTALYHVNFEGLAPISRLSPDGRLEITYRPWPGESLTVLADKLEAAKGTSVTLERASLDVTPGSRMEQLTFSFSVRTSRGTSERVRLPKDASLTGLSVDGQPRSARVKDGQLELHLDPGQHQVRIALQRHAGLGTSYTTPSLGVGRALTNVTTRVNLPHDRWLLWAHGPSWGPAILFWGYLVLVVLVAVALGRVPSTPLRTREWALLGLGLTQVEAWVSLLIVGWLFALAYRERHRPGEGWFFNLTQVALVVLTFTALVCLGHAVHQGLVVQPDMQVQGQGSTNGVLQWYTDRTDGSVPTAQVWSLPLWVYRGLMLLWALWLAASLLRWLRWGWSAFRAGGGGWQGTPRWHPKPEKVNPRVPLEDIERAQAELDAARASEAGEASPSTPPQAPEEPPEGERS